VKLLLSIVSALVIVGATPVLAGQPLGGQSGGCRIACSPYGGGNHNVNINANAYADAHAQSYAQSYAGSGGYIEARGYDVRSIAPRPAWVTVSSSEYYGSSGGYGYGHAAYGPVVVRGPGYGPSRPFGYVVEGFGRRYATTDRCDDRCYGPPPPCDCEDDRHYGHGQPGYDYNRYSGRSGSSYSVRESYSESSAYAGGYRTEAPRYEAPRYEAPRYPAPRYEAPRYEAPRYPAPRYEAPVYDAPVYASPVYEAPVYEAPVYEQPVYEAPRYEARPYYAAPLEPVTVQPDYAPPPVYYSRAEPEPYYAPQPEPRPQHAAPPRPLGYYGDLPPGDTGQGMPYRQEPGERG
jgi:hypothetical protein